MARVGLGARRLVLEAKQSELVPRLGGGQLLLVARPLLSRVELERALFLVLLVGVRSRMKLHLVGDSVQGSADEDFVGKEVSIASGFNESSPGRGRVSYRGADWNARSEQAAFAPGDIIKITGREGNTLFVNQETN